MRHSTRGNAQDHARQLTNIGPWLGESQGGHQAIQVMWEPWRGEDSWQNLVA